MSNEILVPSLGESVTEATVTRWLKNIGDPVDIDEPLVELETDKVNVEVPSPISGTLSEIKVQQGQTVEVGGLLGVLGNQSVKEKKNKTSIVKKELEEKLESKETLAIDKKINPKKISTLNEPITLEEQPMSDETLILKEQPVSEEPLVLNELVEETNTIKNNSKEVLSPAVRRMVAEKNIDISKLQGSGKEGRILKEDLLDLMGSVPEPSQRKKTHGQEERIKMSKLRITIARRLKQAQNNAALLTTFNEVDMKNVIDMRKNYKEDFEKNYSVKLGFMSFFVKSCIIALKNFPTINAQIENDEIIYKNYYNVGVAVGTDRGLVVPVLNGADEMSFADIEKNINRLSIKAKEGKITIDDLQGATFTISNGGIYGSMLSTPILNPPQSGILGMHNIVERAVVINSNIEIRPIMYLALSYDHRIVDGKEAVSFLKCIKECLEEPRRLFLDI